MHHVWCHIQQKNFVPSCLRGNGFFRIERITHKTLHEILGILCGGRTGIFHKKSVSGINLKRLMICRRSDSNRHGASPAGFWVQCVYQFHHSGATRELVTKRGAILSRRKTRIFHLVFPKAHGRVTLSIKMSLIAAQQILQTNVLRIWFDEKYSG